MMETPVIAKTEANQVVAMSGRVAVPDLPTFDVELPEIGGASGGSHGLEALFDVPVKVQAVLGRSRMPIGDLLRLRVGTVVELDRRVGEPVNIFVNNRLIARGEVVIVENLLGVTLTEIVRDDA